MIRHGFAFLRFPHPLFIAVTCVGLAWATSQMKNLGGGVGILTIFFFFFFYPPADEAK